MKVKIKKLVEVNIKTLHVKAGVRYWEDATVNGVEDVDGKLIPCRDGENWYPIIDIESGKIIDWEIGKTANIHYKVCDNGEYCLLDENEEIVIHLDGYVPKTLSPEGIAYGDYIKMKVNSEGYIDKWNFDISDFIEDEE